VLALAEFDCTILVDDDNKKYLLDSVNAAIYFRASVLNQGGMGERPIFEGDTVREAELDFATGIQIGWIAWVVFDFGARLRHCSQP
jgi:hypothetical protein